MKIKIEHISNTCNYGSLMMAINTLNKLNLSIDSLEFFVDVASEKDLNRLKLETGLSNIKMYKKAKGDSSLSKVKKLINKYKLIKNEKHIYDLKLVLGGDDISEYYTKKAWLKLFPIMYLEAINMPTVLLGQTIGPFTSYRKLLARFALNKTKIYVRDDNCLEYLKGLGIKSAKNGKDLAFLSLPMQYKAKHILNKYSLKANDYITIVPSGLTECYTSNLNAYIKEQVNILNCVLKNKILSDKKIVLLPHVLLPKHVDDRNIIREVMKNIDEEYKSRIIAIYDEMLASEAREILGNGLFTITGRMHAAVSTFFMRKPAISLSYSVKYAGVIGEGLDMNELVIEASNEGIWDKGLVSDLVSQKVDFILDNYEALIKKIDDKVNETSSITEAQLEDLVNYIKILRDKKK